MKFSFNCPICEQQLEAEEGWVGLKSVCSHCNNEIVIEKNTQPTPNTVLKLPPRPNEPKFTPAATQNKLHHASHNEEPLADTAEDGFVLRYLNAFKNINRILASVAWLICVISAVICFADGDDDGFYWIAASIFIVYLCTLENLLLSWLRGIYRNILCLKGITQKISISTDHLET
jgi:hypothetical protein